MTSLLLTKTTNITNNNTANNTIKNKKERETTINTKKTNHSATSYILLTIKYTEVSTEAVDKAETVTL